MNAGVPGVEWINKIIPCVVQERQEAQGKGKIPDELQKRYDIVCPKSEGGAYRIIKGEEYEIDLGDKKLPVYFKNVSKKEQPSTAGKE